MIEIPFSSPSFASYHHMNIKTARTSLAKVVEDTPRTKSSDYKPCPAISTVVTDLKHLKISRNHIQCAESEKVKIKSIKRTHRIRTLNGGAQIQMDTYPQTRGKF